MTCTVIVTPPIRLRLMALVLSRSWESSHIKPVNWCVGWWVITLFFFQAIVQKLQTARSWNLMWRRMQVYFIFWWIDYHCGLIMPPDIVCRRTYILPVFLLLSFFRRLISKVAERNSTKMATWPEVSVIWKRMSNIWGIPSPNKSGAQKPPFWADFAT